MHFSLLRSKEEVRGLSSQIGHFARIHAIPCDLTHLPEYFLGRLEPQMRPCVAVGWDGNSIAGVLYACERKIAGIPTGWCFGGDEMGRGLLVTRPGEENRFFTAACTFLLEQGIHAFRMRRRREHDTDLSFHFPRQLHLRTASHTLVRPEGDWLQLGDNFERFLAKLGPHTRRNLRYYRRKAEAERIRFEPGITLSNFNDAVEHLRTQADYHHPPDRHARDQRFFQLVGNPVLAGLRVENGPFVSIFAAVRFRDCLHVLSQINDSGLRRMSISIVLRSYLIEWAIAQGVRSMHFLNGTTPMLGRYCNAVHVQNIFLDQDRSLTHPFKVSGAQWARSLQRNGKWVPMRLRTMLGTYLPED